MVQDVVARRLLILILIVPVFTIATNTDTLKYGDEIRYGLSISDFVSINIHHTCFYILPFLLGWNYLRTPEAHAQFLIATLVAFFYYSVPILWEIRMSPQIHTNVYGFFPHDFVQQMRGEGFRPVVFLGHGLLVAFFVATAMGAAVVMWKTGRKPMQKAALFKLGFIGGVLVLCKTVSALIYGLLFFVAFRFLTPKTHIKIAVILSLIVISFPVLRSEKNISRRGYR